MRQRLNSNTDSTSSARIIGEWLRGTLPGLMTGSHRVPPPWSVEETDACFVIRDANGQAIAYVYFEDEPGRQAAAKLMTRDEARRRSSVGCKLFRPNRNDENI
jgi:hypothetical protein